MDNRLKFLYYCYMLREVGTQEYEIGRLQVSVQGEVNIVGKSAIWITELSTRENKYRSY